MKMIDHTPGREPKRIDLIRLFKRRDVIGGLDDGATCRIVCAVLLGCQLSPCIKIVPIGFAILRISVVNAVRRGNRLVETTWDEAGSMGLSSGRSCYWLPSHAAPLAQTPVVHAILRAAADAHNLTILHGDIETQPFEHRTHADWTQRS